eukprot:6001253-Amphidinium_carterae.1
MREKSWMELTPDEQSQLLEDAHEVHHEDWLAGRLMNDERPDADRMPSTVSIGTNATKGDD